LGRPAPGSGEAADDGDRGREEEGCSARVENAPGEVKNDSLSPTSIRLRR
jgi:hypothetical protein